MTIIIVILFIIVIIILTFRCFGRSLTPSHFLTGWQLPATQQNSGQYDQT